MAAHLEGEVIVSGKANDEAKELAKQMRAERAWLREVFGIRAKPHLITDAKVVEFITRPILIPHGHQLIEWSGHGRKPTKTRWEQSNERRRSLYHKLIRLPSNHPLAANACKQQGAKTRAVVFNLFQIARDGGTADRHLVRDVQKLFASRPNRHKGLAPPGERQLRRLLKEFLKVGMSA
ncbi:MAG: hypothetical protein GZ085_11180 [Sulfuriferula multivorans]|uniref:Uncharacterized protein n=1 Tax=Sulfuriferula multivorans TaxID=1559896 RepID=A0A7C9TB98_9PROT|nr:hypothetical protein [Sulfuriferula multivorans]